MPEQVPNLQPVSSTNLAAIGYDASSQNLYIQWKDGRISVYEGVPSLIVSDLQNASSPGWAFNETIKDRYKHRYVSQ